MATFGTQAASGSLVGSSLLCSKGSPFLGNHISLLCDLFFISGERDFPASCSVRGGTFLQEVCSSPKLTLFLPSFDIFHYFPTALTIQTTICLIFRLHSSNPFSFHFPSWSGILAILASLSSFREPRTDHRFFPTCSSSSPRLILSHESFKSMPRKTFADLLDQVKSP